MTVADEEKVETSAARQAGQGPFLQGWLTSVQEAAPVSTLNPGRAEPRLRASARLIQLVQRLRFFKSSRPFVASIPLASYIKRRRVLLLRVKNR